MLDKTTLDFPVRFATLRHGLDWEPFAIILARDFEALRSAVLAAEQEERSRLDGDMSEPVLGMGILFLRDVWKQYSQRLAAQPDLLALLPDLVAGRVDALTF